MPWHDEAPWAERKRRAQQRREEAALIERAKAEKEARVEEVRRALRSFDFGGMSVDRFFDEVRQIATTDAARIGEQHRPEVRG